MAGDDDQGWTPRREQESTVPGGGVGRRGGDVDVTTIFDGARSQSERSGGWTECEPAESGRREPRSPRDWSQMETEAHATPPPRPHDEPARAPAPEFIEPESDRYSWFRGLLFWR